MVNVTLSKLNLRWPNGEAVDYATLSASERQFLPPAVAVSTIAFALAPPKDAESDPGLSHGSVQSVGGDTAHELTLWIPLVRRTRAPFLGKWALPGGATQWNEPLSGTAQRTLGDAVGRSPGYLEQLYSFGGVERSAEAQRLVTIAYWALYGGLWQPSEHAMHANRTQKAPGPSESPAATVTSSLKSPRWDDPELPAPTPDVNTEALETFADALQLSADPVEAASNVAWFAVDRLPDLAFDHAEIVAHALDRLRSKTEYAQVAHRFLGASFTLAQLRRVHEAVQGRAVDPANFRRQALAQGSLEATGGVETGTRHRPAKLYRFVDPEA